MRVLLTGAFGNVGTSALEELVRQGHQVRCFDLQTRANERAARRFRGQIELLWGDLRRPDDVAAAVRDRDVVIHLAFIIPKLSVTGVGSEDRPDWAREVNVGGTRNLLDAMKAQPRPPKIVFSSSMHVYGNTQDLLPCRTADDPVQATDHYTSHKIACEQMVRSSGLDWAIFRFGAVLPLCMKLDPGMFDVPLNNRIEFVHTRDVGLALANAVVSEDVWDRILLIGGGPGCQFYYRDLAGRILTAMGMGMLPDEAFSTVPFSTDWLDTDESQRLIDYQRRSLDDYIQEMIALLGYRRYFVRLFRPFVRRALLKQSPYFREYQERRARPGRKVKPALRPNILEQP